VSATEFNFADRYDLIDFLVDGETTLVADYLDQSRAAVAHFFEIISSQLINDDELQELSDAFRSGDKKYITFFRELLGDAPDVAINALPLTTSPQQRPRTPIITRARRMAWPLAGTALAASIAASVLFIDLSDIKEYFSPNNDGALSETTAGLSGSFNGDVPSISPSQPDLGTIDDAVEEALSPITHDYAQSLEFNSHGVEGLYQDTDGTIFYQDWEVPNDVYEANILTAQITGLPLSYMFAAQATESAVGGMIDPNATNTMGTCGLNQFVRSTLAEYAYNYSDLIGFDGIRDDLIVRTRTRLEGSDANGDPLYQLSHDYADPLSRATIERVCVDPHFNTRLGAIMKLRDIGMMQRNLADLAPEGHDFFPVTELQAYVALFAGRTGAENLIEDLVSNDGSTNVTNFFSATARSNSTNQWILYHTKTIINADGEEAIVPDTSNPRTVAEFFANLEETRPLTNAVLPNFTDWSSIREFIETNIAELERTTIRVSVPPPIPRPAHLGDTPSAT